MQNLTPYTLLGLCHIARHGLLQDDDDAEQDGSSVSARKRRRLRYNNARDAAEKAKQADATQIAATDGTQLSPGFASNLLQVL